MTVPNRIREPSGWTAPATDPRALLRMHRQYLLAQALPGPGDQAPLTELPDPIRGLVHAYQAAHPGVRVDVYWYIDLNGADTVTRGDVAAVPEDDDAVILSLTETMLTSDAATVRSHVALGRRTSG
jgi:hypothetical protein